MTMAQSRLGWQIVAGVLLTGALAWMIFPTYPMQWMGDPNTGADGPVTYHSWVAPIVWGFGAFHAPVLVLCALIAAIGAWLGVVVRRPNRVPAWWALGGVVIFLAWSIVLGGLMPVTIAPLGLVAGGAAAVLLAARRALPPVIRWPAAR